jgi:dTDP-4-dehydrorhamnose 3,5-epimerase
MEINKSFIPGLLELLPEIKTDKRGKFIKTFHKDVYIKNNLEVNFTEEYYTFSHQNVLRGLHFQIPPKHHTKLVYCVLGEVLDVVVDLRKGSPTYGKYALYQLSSKKGNMIYIPPGMAHGFYVVSESAILMYKVSEVYSPEHDSGIYWGSVGIPWPNLELIISERDRQLPNLSLFQSPFIYKENS